MSEQTWRALAILAPTLAVIIGRVMSHFEHRKTSKDVEEIKFYLNGGLKKTKK